MDDQLTRMRTALGDRYAIDRELGRGGMATAYLAEDLKYGRSVAIKVLRPDKTESLGTERFLREIHTLANLQHPNILPLHDSGSLDSLLYFVMPYVEGETLRHRLDRERQLPLDETIRIASEVADGVCHAHARGIIHRDIKPENILLSKDSHASGGRDHAVVSDFGIARAISVAENAQTQLTGIGISVGTPGYMSSEQAAGKMDAAVDEFRFALALDPFSDISNVRLATGLFFAHRYDESVRQANRLLELNPNFFQGHTEAARPYLELGRCAESLAEIEKSPDQRASILLGARGYTYAKCGQLDKARAELDRLREAERQGQYIPHYGFAMTQAGLGDFDRVFAELDSAYRERDWGMFVLAHEPAFDPIRSDSRFRALLRKMNLTER